MFKQYFFKYTEDLSLLFLYKNLINGINESLFLEVLMMEIRWGGGVYHIRHIKKWSRTIEVK